MQIQRRVCVCVRARVCVCLQEALRVGEPGSAGTHSCCMVPFQEELLDLFVFTGSQIVRARRVLGRARLGVGPIASTSSAILTLRCSG